MPLHINIDEEAQPLTRRFANHDFQQQGEVDWVSLSRSSVTFSLGILSRLSAASIDPYTVTVGNLLGNIFELSQDGRRHIEHALSRLRCFQGVGNLLWFGFGIKHIVRAICVTEQGAILVALAAALAECFDEDESARVLHFMAKRLPGLNFVPSLTQWRALIRSCSGLLAATPFPLRAENLMNMSLRDRSRLRSRTGTEGGIPNVGFHPSHERRSTNPEDLAEVLLAIGRVSRHEWNSITIIGSREAGWAAAVAEWLFGLSVIIHDECNDIKYTNSGTQEAHVKVMYHTAAESGQGPTLLQVKDKTLSIRNTLELVQSHDPNRYDMKSSRYCGRVDWQTCLGAAFGNAFEKLMQEPDIFGEVFGTASRISEALAKNEYFEPDRFGRHKYLYSIDSTGMGFIQGSLHWLPELAGAGQSMWEAYRTTSASDAKHMYHTRCLNLVARCNCSHCSEYSGDMTLMREESCLLILAETIIRLCNILSTLEVVDTLRPMLRGFHALATSQQRRRVRTHLHAKVLDHHESDLWECLSDRPEERMEAALQLFAGRSLIDLGYGEKHDVVLASALCKGGICVYLDHIRELTDSKELAGRIHVIPGHIEFNGQPFLYLKDWPGISDPVALGLLPKFEATISDQAQMSGFSVEVRESFDCLEIRYSIQNDQRKPVNIYISPAKLTRSVLRSHMLVSCPDAHQSQPADERQRCSHSLLCRIEREGIRIKHLKAPLLGRCAALMLARKKRLVFSQHDECFSCHVKAALQYYTCEQNERIRAQNKRIEDIVVISKLQTS